jgi:hypothetical protein
MLLKDLTARREAREVGAVNVGYMVYGGVLEASSELKELG